MSLSSELTATILERIERNQLPRAYMKLPGGFRFGTTGPGLVLSHENHTETVTLGSIERGRWCLSLNWRDDVKAFVQHLGLNVVETNEELPF